MKFFHAFALLTRRLLGQRATFVSRYAWSGSSSSSVFFIVAFMSPFSAFLTRFFFL